VQHKLSGKATPITFLLHFLFLRSRTLEADLEMSRRRLSWRESCKTSAEEGLGLRVHR